ncbi:leucine-rich repeat-containing protein 49-like [Limulus polyphemus]|uniref:Dynein axonemal assembly factor 1 homolog n=1 Tax=Limulus polyphemus TaxID=6850 RepID=A0ABM1BTD1_LIMPO|nr:leucine-rich repeat-containing protein 49-like [Limulus polyphemus]
MYTSERKISNKIRRGEKCRKEAIQYENLGLSITKVAGLANVPSATSFSSSNSKYTAAQDRKQASVRQKVINTKKNYMVTSTSILQEVKSRPKSAINTFYGDKKNCESSYSNRSVVQSTEQSIVPVEQRTTLQKRLDQKPTSVSITNKKSPVLTGLPPLSFDFISTVGNINDDNAFLNNNSSSNEGLKLKSKYCSHDPKDPTLCESSVRCHVDIDNDSVDKVLTRYRPRSETGIKSLPWFQGQLNSDIHNFGKKSPYTSKTASSKSKLIVQRNLQGELVIKRTPEEHQANPEKLVLVNIGLKECPILEDENQLQLLNYQHNKIQYITNLAAMRNLVFLELSDNCIECISGLQNVVSLRVLLLSRNKIRNIEGLDNLTNLDVLDLSGNKISEIANLSHLENLRILNLSENNLAEMKQLQGLKKLVELNLSNNSISLVQEVNELQSLQRLFLSHNQLENCKQIDCLREITTLNELAFDGCPLTKIPNYRSLILGRLMYLNFLDFKRITDEEKRVAIALVRREEFKAQETLRLAKIKEAREQAIKNAQQQWETALKQGKKTQLLITEQKSGFVDLSSPKYFNNAQKTQMYDSDQDEDDDDVATHFLHNPNKYTETYNKRRQKKLNETFVSQKKTKLWKRTLHRSTLQKKCLSKSNKCSLNVSEIENFQPAHLVELIEGKLLIYGIGGVKAALHHSWNSDSVSNITTLGLNYIFFEDIASVLTKFAPLFPYVTCLIFYCANITCLSQLSALVHVSNLQSLVISPEGNSVTELVTWRLYTVYRLGQSLRILNNILVTPLERSCAEKMFGGLLLVISSYLPQYKLSSLLADPQVKEALIKEKGYSPNILQKHPENPVLSDALLKTALCYRPHNNEIANKSSAKENLVQASLTAVKETLRKRAILKNLWPSMFHTLIADSLLEFKDLNSHMKKSLRAINEKQKFSGPKKE